MKHPWILIISLCCLTAVVRARETKKLGGWATVTSPELYQTGEAFTVKVEVHELEAATRLVVSANWMQSGNRFGGFLQYLGRGKAITGPGIYEFPVTITHTKPDMESLLLAVFLSPDGNWKNRTKEGTVTIHSQREETAAHEETVSAEPVALPARPAPPPESTVPVRPTDPPSLRVRVGGGTLETADGRRIRVPATTLELEPPEIERFHAQDRKGNPRAAPVNFAGYHKDWEPWPNALGLTPRLDRSHTLILGSFFRYWRPETLVVKDGQGNVKERDRDFVFNEDWGLILNLNSGLGEPKTGKLEVSAEAALPRIDLIQVHPDGRVAVKRGQTRLVCAPRPLPDPGWTGLATVYIAPWRAANNPHHDGDPTVVEGATEYAVTATEIYPMFAPEPVPPLNPDALDGTRAKLSAGATVKIAFMGDSIMVGAEATAWYVKARAYTAKDRTMRGSFIYQLRQRFPKSDIRPVHAFKGGETIKYAQNIYDRMVTPENVDLVVVEFGANDMDSSISGSPKNSPAEFKHHVGRIIDRAKADGVEVMLVTPLPRNPWFKNGVGTRQLHYHRVLYELSEEKDVALAPVFRMFQQLPAQGIPVYNTLHNWNNHPGDLGHAIYAAAMLKTLRAAGSE